MKNLLLTIVAVIFTLTSFCQSFIGYTKKDLLNSIKEKASSIDKPVKSNDEFKNYSITAKFPFAVAIYTFSKNDICWFYMGMEKYSYENMDYTVKDYDSKYLRAFPDLKTNINYNMYIWKEVYRGTFVYRWIIINTNKNIMCTLFLTQENYENNRMTYLKNILGE